MACKTLTHAFDPVLACRPLDVYTCPRVMHAH